MLMASSVELGTGHLDPCLLQWLVLRDEGAELLRGARSGFERDTETYVRVWQLMIGWPLDSLATESVGVT